MSTGEPAIRSRYARLLILVPPEPPKILKGPVIQAVEDREVNVECVSIGGKPPAEVYGILIKNLVFSINRSQATHTFEFPDDVSKNKSLQ